MKTLHMITFTLLVVGGLNWLLHAFDWNLVDMIFGAGSTGAMVVYVVVGLSAIWEVLNHKKNCRNCNPAGMGM